MEKNGEMSGTEEEGWRLPPPSPLLPLEEQRTLQEQRAQRVWVLRPPVGPWAVAWERSGVSSE